ncbi:MAG: hypothetical protein NVSMB57_05790 [Actinomycetota bacterium]
MFGRFGLCPARRIAKLSVGAGNEHRANALLCGKGEYASRTDRFIIRVGMYGHQR